MPSLKAIVVCKNLMERIEYYFPHLSAEQKKKFSALPKLYKSWNEQINVISRKDIDQIEVHHILHALAIAKVVSFADHTKILDVGCGGGFPGIPLAIFFPKVQFTLVDSIAKKIKVVQDISQQLELKNVRAIVARAENIPEKFDFVVSRAVTQMPEFIKWVRKSFLLEHKNSIPNGILYLKGGDLVAELKRIQHELFEIAIFFSEPFFEEKKVVYVQM